MVNKLDVLEHIAKAVDKEVVEIERAVTIEYWKDGVSFTNFKAVDLFAEYLRSQGIKEVKGVNQLSVKISRKCSTKIRSIVLYGQSICFSVQTKI